jgi:hypothetical protein
MRGIMLSLTQSKMILLDLACLFLYAALPVFEVGSSITLVMSSYKSPSSSMLSTLDFQALKLEAPSSLFFALTEDEVMLNSGSDYEMDLVLIYKTNPKKWIYAGSSLQLLSSFHALSFDSMLELGKIEKQNALKNFCSLDQHKEEEI